VLAALRRPAKFVVVGAVCFGVQYGFLLLLDSVGVLPWVGNGLGFVASAQLNFVLSSRVTWGDRGADAGGRFVRRWVSYQGSALLALAVNVAVFVVLSPHVWRIAASGAGVLVGSACSYAVNHLLVFRAGRPAEEVAR
jgi:putative flippase GtrA